MRTLVLLPALALLLSGCGGASLAPASAASATSATSDSATGAAAITGALPEGALLSMDLAGMRSDSAFATVMTKAHASAAPDVAELMDRVDRIDCRAGHPNHALSAVCVVWGRLPKDPTELAMFRAGSAHPLEPAAPLASGVRAFADGKGERGHVFVVSDSVWVVATGPAIEVVRSHFASTAEAPAQPKGDLLRVTMDSAALRSLEDGDEGPLTGLDHAALTVDRGTTSVEGLLSFKDEGAANAAEAKVQMLSSLVLAGAASKAKDCAALGKIGVDVHRGGKDVTVVVKGIAEAAEAWNPAVCPKLGEGDGAPAPSDVALERSKGGKGGGEKHSKPTKVPAHGSK